MKKRKDSPSHPRFRQVEDAETKEDRMAARLDLAYALAAQRDVEAALNKLLEHPRGPRLAR